MDHLLMTEIDVEGNFIFIEAPIIFINDYEQEDQDFLGFAIQFSEN